ncbi:outer membrane beta-barrel protein [Proteiniphilum sp.]|uniref:outer membrane beta-barrel protein n=1 Tax=Proteiniphilum sp. TaxID=1926877 RepID=UPI002B217010|nr:outer membrane beta-barrel protein [Proteiniphilum sp.]MEA4916280.1 outer membrane beta-barrel protein [Proteiniphilum sp.]
MKRIYLITLAVAMIGGLAVSSATAQQRNSSEVNVSPQSYKDFRISVGGGYAFRLGKVQKTGDAKVDDVSKQLKHGFTVDADAQYFFKEGWGLGLNVNYCSSPASGEDLDLQFIDGTRRVNKYKESQNMLFVGPSFVGRNESPKFLLVSSFAIGPIFYMDNINMDGIDGSMNATTFGYNAGLAGEYKLNDKTGLGLKLSYTMGSINSIKSGGQTVKLDKPISVSNLMATVFISFRTW